MKFKNNKTGNVLSTDNAVTISLMQKSDRYDTVTEPASESNSSSSSGSESKTQAAKESKKSEVKQDGTE